MHPYTQNGQTPRLTLDAAKAGARHFAKMASQHKPIRDYKERLRIFLRRLEGEYVMDYLFGEGTHCLIPMRISISDLDDQLHEFISEKDIEQINKKCTDSGEHRDIFIAKAQRQARLNRLATKYNAKVKLTRFNDCVSLFVETADSYDWLEMLEMVKEIEPSFQAGKQYENGHSFQYHYDDPITN